MERNNDKFIAVVALLFAVVCLSVGFAALSTSLSINGSATVQSSTWSVRFLDGSLKVQTSSNVAGTVSATTPTLSATTIGDFSVTMKAPNDTVNYIFSVTNNGSYNAKISSITIPTPTCSSTPTTEATKVCSKLSYTLKYYDNNTVGANVAKNDTLNAGTTKQMILTLNYSDSVTGADLPTADVTISSLGVTIIYVQA